MLLGNELTKKASTLDESNVFDSVDDPNDGHHSKKLRVIDEATDDLNDILASGEQDLDLDGKYKALFEMDFMKKAREQKQLRAKEEAKNLLREIEDMEAGISESEDELTPSEKKTQVQKTKESNQKHKEKLEEARKQMATLMAGKNGLNLSTQSDNGIKATESIQMTELLQQNPWLDPTAKLPEVLLTTGGEGDKKKNKKKRGRQQQESSEIDEENKEDNQNLEWITSSHIPQTSKKISEFIPAVQTLTSKGKKEKSKSGILIDSESESKSEPTRKPLLMQKSQQDLVNLAFSGPDLEADFESLKEKIIDEELNISEKKRKILSEGMEFVPPFSFLSSDKAGWGDWAGPGMAGVSQKIVRKRQRLLKNLDEKKAEMKAGRTDHALANVILSEKRIKTASKYKLADVPHPFTSREEYERSIQMPVGSEDL